MMRRLPLIVIAGLLVVATALAITQRPQRYFPSVQMEASLPVGDMKFGFLFESQLTLRDCEALTGNVVRVALRNCPQCRVNWLTCDVSLSEYQSEILGNGPIPMPSGRMANGGVVIYETANPALALAVCKSSEEQSAGSKNPVKCFDANTPREQHRKATISVLWSVVASLAAFASAWLVGWFIIRYEHLHAHLSHDHVDSGPQKYHKEPTPRIGGLGVMVGLLAAGGIMLYSEALPTEREFGLLLLAAMPAFLGGLVEDVTKRVGVTERLLLTMLAGATAAWLLGAVLDRLDVPGLDQLLRWLPFAVALTSFAVGGIANSINIIDGYNGLAAGFSMIVLGGLALVGYLVGDDMVFGATVVLIGALGGFLVWNWPKGKIFLGDGGAYLVGFMLAELSVMLVTRNPRVSPWFPMVLLSYPVTETFYSIYRRRFMLGLSPGQPDNRHLHQLIHDFVVLGAARQRSTELSSLEANSRVAKYLWIPSAVAIVAACSLWDTTRQLIATTIVCCIVYVICYRTIFARAK